jgi:hypothetical protein
MLLVSCSGHPLPVARVRISEKGTAPTTGAKLEIARCVGPVWVERDLRPGP